MEKELIKQFINLYQSNNSNKILQSTEFDSYLTVSSLCIHNNIEQLVKYNTLLGFFSPTNKEGKEVTKFFTLDFDFTDLNLAKKAVNKVLDIMENVFEIEEDSYRVNFSGNKGYHVTIYFDNYISLNTLKNYYKMLLFLSGYSASDIEFRPTSKHGVKLPLSTHPTTKKVAYFVNRNFEEVSKYTLLNVKPLNVEDFAEFVMEEIFPKYKKDKDFKIKSSKIRITGSMEDSFQHVLSDTNLSNRMKAEYILENGMQGAKTRHHSTLLLATYFNSINESREVAEKKIFEVIEKTYMNNRADFGSTLTFAKKEAVRLLKYVYRKNITFMKNLTNIKIFKKEIDLLLTISNSTLRNILLALLIHSKGHNELNGNKGEFFCSYRQLQNYGINLSSDKIKAYYKELEMLGFITITNKSELKVVDKITGNRPTTHLIVNMRETKGNEFITINSKDYNYLTLEFEQFAGLFYTADELKLYYSKTTFYRRIKAILENAQNITGLSVSKLVKMVSDIAQGNIEGMKALLALKKENVTLAENPLKAGSKKEKIDMYTMAKNLGLFSSDLLCLKNKTGTEKIPITIRLNE